MVSPLRKNCMLCIFLSKSARLCAAHRGGGLVHICMWWKEIWHRDETRLIFTSCMFFLVNVVVGSHNVGSLFITSLEPNTYTSLELGLDRIALLIL